MKSMVAVRHGGHHAGRSQAVNAVISMGLAHHVPSPIHANLAGSRMAKPLSGLQ
jgi:hypothetical protein